MEISPRQMGLMGLASGLLQSSGSSPRPISLGQAMGNGLQQGMQGYQQGQQMQAFNAMNKQREMQAQAEQLKLQQQLQSQETIRSLMQGEQGKPFNQRDVAHSLIKTGDPMAMQQGMEMLKNAPKVKAFNKVNEGGQARYQPMFDDGSYGAASNNPVADKLAFQNLGNQTVALDPYTGKPVDSYAQGISPGQSASLAQSASQFNQSHQLAQQNAMLNQQKTASQFDPEIIQMKAAAQAAGKAGVSEQIKENTRKLSSEKVLGIVDEAEKLLKDSTGSLAGAGIDFLGNAVGLSTKGSIAAAKLKVIQGNLMMAQPRMEGPQSDRDIQLYKEMSASIGDSTVPIAARKAALETIKSLHSKYAGNVPQQSQNTFTSDDGFSSTLN